MIYNSVFPILVQETAQFLQAAGISKAQETPRVTVLAVLEWVVLVTDTPEMTCYGLTPAGS